MNSLLWFGSRGSERCGGWLGVGVSGQCPHAFSSTVSIAFSPPMSLRGYARAERGREEENVNRLHPRSPRTRLRGYARAERGREEENVTRLHPRSPRTRLRGYARAERGREEENVTQLHPRSPRTRLRGSHCAERGREEENVTRLHPRSPRTRLRGYAGQGLPAHHLHVRLYRSLPTSDAPPTTSRDLCRFDGVTYAW